MTKYRQIVEVSTWGRNCGWIHRRDTIEDDVVELAEQEDADPIYWWDDYCGNLRSNHDDLLVAVTLLDPETGAFIAEYSRWESDAGFNWHGVAGQYDEL